jgi:hypothetical protein
MTKEHQGDWRREWEAATFRKVAQSSLLLILVFSAVLCRSAQPSVALGTCGATEVPDINGKCQTCPPRQTSASISKDNLSAVFEFAGIQNANFTVSNNLGTFNIAGTNLANFGFNAPVCVENLIRVDAATKSAKLEK